MNGGTRDRDPVPLRDSVAALGRDLGLPDPEVLGRVAATWSELAGPAVAAHAPVRSVRNGVCTVTADGPAWATEIRYLEAELVERCRAAFGEGVVTRLEVAVSAPRTTDS